jgi:hypothetical protein
MRVLSAAVTLGFALSLLLGCRTRTFSESSAKDVGASDDATGSVSASARMLEIQVATDMLLSSIEKSDMLAPRYKSGTRVEACWVIPVGKELADAQRSFLLRGPFGSSRLQYS